MKPMPVIYFLMMQDRHPQVRTVEPVCENCFAKKLAWHLQPFRFNITPREKIGVKS
jgi:hypothetical protein